MAVQGGDGAGPNDEVHIRDIEATGASKEGVGRWVLLLGTALVILLLGAVALFGGLSQDTVEEEATVSGRIDSVEQDSGTDGVLLGDDGSESARDIGDQDGSTAAGETIPNAAQDDGSTTRE